jgi:hypothetical protein
VKQPCTYIEPNRKEKKVRTTRRGFHTLKKKAKSLPIPVPFNPGWSYVFQIPYPHPRVKKILMRAVFVPWEEVRWMYLSKEKEQSYPASALKSRRRTSEL